MNSILRSIRDGNEPSLRWFPTDLSPRDLSLGAGGLRPVGRLAYFFNRDGEKDIKSLLSGILDGFADNPLSTQMGRYELNVNAASGVDVHLITSLCGGTGAGIFLDLAYDIIEWSKPKVHTMGHLVFARSL